MLIFHEYRKDFADKSSDSLRWNTNRSSMHGERSNLSHIDPQRLTRVTEELWGAYVGLFGEYPKDFQPKYQGKIIKNFLKLRLVKFETKWFVVEAKDPWLSLT